MAACDPQTLVSAANCLDCGVAPGMQFSLLIVLAAQIAGVSADPQTLTTNAASYRAIPPGLRMPVLIALACQIAGV